MAADGLGVLVAGDINGAPKQASLTRYDTTGALKWSLAADGTVGGDSRITSVITATNTTCGGAGTLQTCVYILGTFNATLKFSETNQFVQPGENAFVEMLTDDGDHATMVWSSYIANTGGEVIPTELAFGSFSNLLIVGWSEGTTALGLNGDSDPHIAGGSPGKIFVASISLTGTAVWIMNPAGSATNALPDGNADTTRNASAWLAADASHNVYLATGSNPDVSTGLILLNQYTESAAGLSAAPVWSATASGAASSSLNVQGLALDSAGNPIITGSTASSALHFSGAVTVSAANYIAKYNTSGVVTWATGFSVGASALAVSSTTSYVFGNSEDPARVLNSVGVPMGVFKFDTAGAQQSLTICGGTSALGQGIATNTDGTVYVAGTLNHPGVFGTLSVATDGVFTAQLSK